MRKTFLRIALDKTEVSQSELARRLGWTRQRVNYLLSDNCKSFAFENLWEVKKALDIGKDKFLMILDAYFTQ